MYNLKLQNKQIRKIIALPFGDIESNDEWIIEDTNNIEVEKVQGEGDSGNVDISGPSSTDPTLEAFDL